MKKKKSTSSKINFNNLIKKDFNFNKNHKYLTFKYSKMKKMLDFNVFEIKNSHFIIYLSNIYFIFI